MMVLGILVGVVIGAGVVGAFLPIIVSVLWLKR